MLLINRREQHVIQGSTPFEGPGATCKTYFPERGHAAYKIEGNNMRYRVAFLFRDQELKLFFQIVAMLLIKSKGTTCDTG